MPTFVLNDQNTINSYDFRVRTDGIDISRFLNNPVMLDSHNNDLQSVLGRWKNTTVNGGMLLADSDFDTAKASAKEVADQVDRGFIKGVSMGISFAVENMVKSVDGVWELIKCQLMEASICAVPSNASAIRLFNSAGQLISDRELKLSLSAINGHARQPEAGIFTTKEAFANATAAQQNTFYQNHYSEFLKLFFPSSSDKIINMSQSKFSNILTPDDFNALSSSDKKYFHTNHNQAYQNLWLDNEGAGLNVGQYVPSKVTTVDDFMKLSASAKLDFRDNHRLAYKALWPNQVNRVQHYERTGNTSANAAMNNARLLAEPINYVASSVNTSDDFEKLTAAEKMDFKINHNEAYTKLWHSDGYKYVN